MPRDDLHTHTMGRDNAASNGTPFKKAYELKMLNVGHPVCLKVIVKSTTQWASLWFKTRKPTCVFPPLQMNHSYTQLLVILYRLIRGDLEGHIRLQGDHGGWKCLA